MMTYAEARYILNEIRRLKVLLTQPERAFIASIVNAIENSRALSEPMIDQRMREIAKKYEINYNRLAFQRKVGV